MPTPVYTFTPGTVIQSSQVNTNFALLTQCVSKTGDTLTGTLNSQSVVPSTNTAYNLGASTKAFLGVYAKGLYLLDSDNSNFVNVAIGSDMSADRTLTINMPDADTTLTLGGSIVLSGTPYAPGGTDVALADGGTGASLADPNADRILFWDDSAGHMDWLAAGSGITITGTTISASVTGGVTAGSALTDNKLIRGDGGSSGVQTSGVNLDDFDNMTGVNIFTCNALDALISTAKSTGTVYQAGADGIMTATVDCTAGGGSVGQVKILSDSSNPPTTVIGGAVAQDGQINMASVPVIRGNFYKAVITTSSGSPNYIVYFHGFGVVA